MSKSWKKIIQHDKQANVRRRNHLSDLKAALEVEDSLYWPLLTYQCYRELWVMIKEKPWLSLTNRWNDLPGVLQRGGSVDVPDAETRLTLLKRSALKTVQAQSRSSSFCTPQSANSTLIQSKHNVTYSGSSSKREKFLEVSFESFYDRFCENILITVSRWTHLVYATT